MIICPICNKEMKCINNMHLKLHGLDMISFKNQYPNFETHSEELKLKNKQNGKKGIPASIIVMKKQAEDRLKENIKSYTSLDKRCKECNKQINYQNKENLFCNHSCAASYTNKIRTVVYSEEAKENHRRIGFRNQANLIDGSSRKGIRKYFNLNCFICHKDFKVTFEKKLNKTCSQECKKLLHSQVNHRENNTYGKFGYYQGIYCASSWELAFLIDSLDIGKKVEHCKLTFTYFMNGEQHTYYPDFIIDDTIYEVKGYEKEDVKLKTEAVIAAGYKIEVIRRKEILPIIKSIKSKYNVKSIIALYDEKLELEVC